MLAQGNALGFEFTQLHSALKGRGISRPFRADSDTWHYTRGVAPGWHPPRRWRGTVCIL
jgi:hypothetical protein